MVPRPEGAGTIEVIDMMLAAKRTFPLRLGHLIPLVLTAVASGGEAAIEDFVWVAGSPGRILRFDLGGGRHKLDASPSGASGIAIDADGNAYVTSAAGLFKIDARGDTVGVFPTTTPGGHSIVVDVAGDVWFTTSVPGRTVERWTRDGEPVFVIADFENPTGIAADGAGGVWVVDSSKQRLTRIAASGEKLFTVPGGGCAGDVAVDTRGHAWVADTCGSPQLLRYAPDGALVSRHDVGAFSIGALAVDGLGQVWVAHPAERAVTVLSTPDGTPVRTIDLADVPIAIAIDGFGNVWVLGAMVGIIERFAARTAEPLGAIEADLLPSARGDATGFTLANVTMPGADFDGDGYANAEEIAAETNPFARQSRPQSWLAGNVNAGLGRVTDVLYVNDHAGDARRTVTATSWEPFSVHVDAPPAARSSVAFVLWARRGAEAPSEPIALPRGIGAVAFPVPLVAEDPGTITVANSFVPGRRRRLGVPRLDCGPAPVTVVRRPAGLGRRATFTLQGLIEDPGSFGPRMSVTNAVFVRIE